MESAVTAVVVDDHPVVAEGVASWIRSDPRRRIELVGVLSDLAALDAAPGPAADVVILDLELGGHLVTAEIPRLVAAGRRIVAFSAHTDPAVIIAVLDSGAHGYVAKDEGADHLVDAVLAAATDRPYVTRSQAKAILADTRAARPGLSAQERHALLLWFQGMSKASVARRMSISENTVRQYINRARMKYATAGRPAPSKDALLARAIEDGIITPAEVAVYSSYAAMPPPPLGPE
jgi:two-component system, NarL family, nitrate/nitrite response regulator NarL